jgi:glycosyltransferase involved in cell wall biosynthesis
MADRLRVLHVVTHLSDAGGAEVSLGQMLPHLDREGITSAVLPLRMRTSTRVAEFESAGIHVAQVPGKSLRHRVTGVDRELRRFRPDVVATSMWDADLAGRIAARRRGVPALATIISAQYSAQAYANAANPRALRAYQALDGVLARHATTAFHALTEAVADEAVDALGVRRQRFAVVPRGRDPERLGAPTAERRRAVRERLGLPLSTPIVLSVARNERQKRLDLLVEAFAAVVAKVPDAVLIQAGRPGAETPLLERLIREEGLQERVRLLGRRADVADLLSAADVFAFSSAWEGLGGSLIEAMAMQVPIVAFDIPPVRETAGAVATLVPFGDTDALGRGLLDVLADAERRRQMAGQGAARFARVYRMESVARQMGAVYRWAASGARDEFVGAAPVAAEVSGRAS